MAKEKSKKQKKGKEDEKFEKKAKGKKNKGADTGEGVSTKGYEPSTDFDVVPAGTYVMALIEAEAKDTKAGTGRRMDCRFQILEGKFKGRLIFTNFNLKNPNEQAVEISMEQLKMLMLSTKISDLKSKWDFSPLLNRKVGGRVKISKGDENYEDSNDISRYIPAADVKVKGASSAKEEAGGWEKKDKKKEDTPPESTPKSEKKKGKKDGKGEKAAKEESQDKGKKKKGKKGKGNKPAWE